MLVVERWCDHLYDWLLDHEIMANGNGKESFVVDLEPKEDSVQEN